MTGDRLLSVAFGHAVTAARMSAGARRALAGMVAMAFYGSMLANALAAQAPPAVEPQGEAVETAEHDAPSAVVPSEPARRLPDPIVRGLGHRLAIWEEAPTLEALIEKVRPDFVLNGHEMVWVAKDEKGQREFTLDRAFVYQGEGQEAKWVLLESREAPYDGWYAEVAGYYTRGIAKLCEQAPEGDHGSGNYAVVKAEHPSFGRLYEVGWQSTMSSGTSLAESERRLHFLESPLGTWQFVGEGPGIGHGKTGHARGSYSSVTSEAAWTGAVDEPVRISFVLHAADYENVTSDDPPEPVGKRDLVVYSDWVLEGRLPATLRRAGETPYLIAEENETIESIAELLTAWSVGAQGIPDARQRWLERLRQLNPSLAASVIPKGTHILVPKGYGYVPGESGNE